MTIAAIAAGLCLAAGAMLLYLSSPNQRWLAAPLGAAGRWGDLQKAVCDAGEALFLSPWSQR